MSSLLDELARLLNELARLLNGVVDGLLLDEYSVGRLLGEAVAVFVLHFLSKSTDHRIEVDLNHGRQVKDEECDQQKIECKLLSSIAVGCLAYDDAKYKN